jgi:Protein of unknown function (DUF3006)
VTPSGKRPDASGRALIIDRFEGDVVVVEVVGGTGTFDLPRWLLPTSAKEGDVITAASDEPGSLRLAVDPAATALRRERATGKVEELRKRDPGGDIAL